MQQVNLRLGSGARSLRSVIAHFAVALAGGLALGGCNAILGNDEGTPLAQEGGSTEGQDASASGGSAGMPREAGLVDTHTPTSPTSEAGNQLTDSGTLESDATTAQSDSGTASVDGGTIPADGSTSPADGGMTTNACSTDLCLNGGTCQNGSGTYSCQCLPAYMGKNCEASVDDCAPKPCLNGGTCVDGVGKYTCQCLLGYSGANCQSVANSCADNPCLNGSTCANGATAGTYVCTCKNGYSGHNCETNVDDCAASPCKNGGVCVDGVASFTCTCKTGFTGATCQTNIDDCTPTSCLNGGTCIDGVNSFTCACKPGFTGTTCQTNINDCSPNPCLNGGTCSDGVNSFTCACKTGFAGTTCQTSTCVGATPNLCASACVNLQTDKNNCGTCGTVCAIGCDQGACLKATAIAAGSNACAVLSNGTVRCWGPNNYGELGIGNTSPSSTPVAVHNLTQATAITVGASHACAIVGGKAQCWGRNESGELGNGVVGDNDAYLVPGAVSTLGNVVAIDAGASVTCAVASGGQVECWGSDTWAQLGDGTLGGPSQGTPVKVGIANGSGVSVGGNFACAQLTDGTATCWGNNHQGVLGIGASNNSTYTPQPVVSTTGITAITSGADASCVLFTTGTVGCWGDDTAGQLGDNGISGDSSGTQTSAFISGAARRISAGNYQQACAVMTNGTVQCWGADVGSITTLNLQPVAVSGLTGVSAIAAGDTFNCALLSTGTVMCWGDNSMGQLGTGTTSATRQTTPVAVKW